MNGLETRSLVGVLIGLVTGSPLTIWLTWVLGRKAAEKKLALEGQRDAQKALADERDDKRDDVRLAFDALKATVDSHKTILESQSRRIEALETNVHRLEQEKLDLLSQLHALELLKSTETQRADQACEEAKRLQAALISKERDLAEARRALRAARKQEN